MTPLMLRQLWTLVETTQATILIKLDDATLVQWLLKQVEVKAPLDRDQSHVLNNYIHSKLSLIRDLAYQRCGTDHL